VLAAGIVLLVGCSEEAVERQEREVPPTPRRLSVWLDESGVDAETVDRLGRAGVDQLVVRRGTITVSGGAPVVQLLPHPPVAGDLPTAAAFRVLGLGSDVDEQSAAAVWSALEGDFGGRLPIELLLDLPEIGAGARSFVASLAKRSGLAVIPILTVSQLETEAGRRIAEAAHRCVVPVFGAQSADLRGLDQMATQPLDVRLAAVRELGVRVRLAAALRPKTDPEVDAWAEDIDLLTDRDVAELRRSSPLDRSFVTLRPVEWGGSSFPSGSTIAIAWVDAPRLGLFLAESHRVVLPEIDGWDLISLPPGESNLGLDRDELIRYLGGEGPAPRITVKVERNGRQVVVRVGNPSVFRSAITAFGNWLQIELKSGSLVASSRGSFDRVVLGSLSTGEWQANPPGGPDAVRFVETYLAPGEELMTGAVRLPSSRSEIVVRWQVQLSDGSVVRGTVD
jgi:hypothetical protein